MKKYDLVLFGATGFTGKLIAQYVSANAPENLRWAIAGRTVGKLQEVADLCKISIPAIVIADIKDQQSLDQMAADTTLLMNTVGPFNWYGYDVVKACVAHHTHYLDITGEPLFVNNIFDKYHELAVKNDCTIVNCCGFDSIPADFATWLTVQKMTPDAPKIVKTFIRTNASFSGGTLTTAINALHEQSQGNTSGSRYKKHPNAPKHKLKLHFAKEIGAWAIPMPVVDPHIVKRTAANLVEQYGPFAYGQYFVRSSFWKVVQTILPIAAAAFLVRFAWFRNWIFKKYHPGTGPSQTKRDQSKFEVISVGTAATHVVKTYFTGGDPGYTETSKMFSEAAFCILEKAKQSSLQYGVLTPVEAFGMSLVEKLKEKGIHIA